MKTSILLPKPPKITKKSKNRATFEIENCYPGYGMTLGNAIRRVLLSSLPGAAITSVRIEGVNHEFSTIPNVFEDVIQVVLNLKQVRFKLHSKGPVSLSINAKGEKKIKASDIKVTSNVEVINKDAYIATLTSKKAKLDMEIEVDSGLGYAMSEQRKDNKLPAGYIAIDVLFSPIKRVKYKVENMRVGDKTNFNRLKLDIETDGSISPEEAFEKAVKILVDHFSIFVKEKKEKKEEKKIIKTKIKKKITESKKPKKKSSKQHASQKKG